MFIYASVNPGYTQLLEQGYRVRTTVRSPSREAAVRNPVAG